MTKFGELLRTCRRNNVSNKITQQELAKAINRDPSFISRLESDDNKPGNKIVLPSAMELERLIQFLRERAVPEVSLEQLRILWAESRSAGRSHVTDDEPLLSDWVATSNALDVPLRKILRKMTASVAYLLEQYDTTNKSFVHSEISFKTAEGTYSELLEQYKNLGNAIGILLYLGRAKQRRYLGNLPGAENDLDQALWLSADAGGDPALRADAWIEKGDLLRRTGRKAEALNAYIEGGKLLSNLSGDRAIPINQRRIASLALYDGNPREALGACEVSLQTARRLGEKEEERKALEHKAWAFALLGRFDEAVELQLEAHQIAESMRVHLKELAKSHRYLGDYFQLCGLTKEAYFHYKEALTNIENIRAEYSENGEEREKLISNMVLLGMSGLYLQGQTIRENPYELVNESLEISGQLGEVLTIGVGHLRKGELFLHDGDTKKARQHFEFALSRFKPESNSLSGGEIANNYYYIAATEIAVAGLEFRLGNFSNARQHTEIALELAQSNGLSDQLVAAKLILARILLRDANPAVDEAIQGILSALDHALSVSLYLSRRTLNAILRDADALSKRNPHLSIVLLNTIVNVLRDKLELMASQSSTKDELRSWLRKMNDALALWQSIQEMP